MAPTRDICRSPCRPCIPLALLLLKHLLSSTFTTLHLPLFIACSIFPTSILAAPLNVVVIALAFVAGVLTDALAVNANMCYAFLRSANSHINVGCRAFSVSPKQPGTQRNDQCASRVCCHRVERWMAAICINPRLTRCIFPSPGWQI